MKNISCIEAKILKYILLKIQIKEWDIGYKIPSERWFAIKFDTSKTLIHNVLLKLIYNGVIEAKSNLGYFVKPFDYDNIIKSETYVLGSTPAEVKIISDGQNLFNDEDYQIFAKLNDNQAIDEKFTFVSKTFTYKNNRIKEILHIGINSKSIPNINKYDLKQGNSQFWSRNDVAICKRNTIIKYVPNRNIFPELLKVSDYLFIKYSTFYDLDNNLIEIGKIIMPALDDMIVSHQYKKLITN